MSLRTAISIIAITKAGRSRGVSDVQKTGFVSVRQAERWPAPWSRRRTFWELEEKVDKKKQKEVELQEIITPSFINEVIY